MRTDTKRTGRWALKEVAAAVAVTAALWANPTSSWGLGTGRLVVQSSIGEALRAEIDITSLSPEESANLRVRVATPDAYRVAGIDYNPVLPSTAVTLQRRADGTPYLQVRSDQAVQEPFVDLILELSWSSGRLLREYTLLFDPPSGRTAATTTTTLPPVAAAVPPKPPVAAPAASKPVEPASATSTAAPAPAPAVPAPAAPPSAATTAATGAGGEYTVRRGDTLTQIASKLPASGLSLDQLVVSLYRGNPHAFMGSNMNRLRSGVVLNLPSSDESAKVDAAQARKLIRAQSADFNAYRRRLAEAVPAAVEPTTPARQSSGKVQSEVKDKKVAQATTPDVLKLDKGKAAPVESKSEDKVAAERAEKEAAARVKEMSRNVEELKKLQAASSALASAPASAVKPAAAASVAASTPAPVAVAPSAPVVAASSASMSSVSSSISTPVLAPASAPAAHPAPPIPMPVPVVPEEEPSLLDTLSENPLVLPGAGLLVAILAGLGWYRLRNKNKEEGGVSSFLESRLQPDSFFGASGGQRIDTRDASGAPSSMSYSLSQIDAIGDVDPVAEADVYLAYGRDLQAEEILKEAMRANPERLAIRTKLLEVYAKRRDIKGFELLAGELYGLTGGQGDEWLKAQELGRQIDPENTLYEPGGSPQTGGPITGSGIEPLGASTMPQSVVPSPSRFEHSVPSMLNINTGAGSLGSPAPDSSSGVDLDISVPGSIDDGRAVPRAELKSSGFGSSGFGGGGFSNSRPAADNGRSMDFNLQEFVASRPGPLTPPPPTPAVSAPAPTVDFSGMSLDLGPTTAGGDLHRDVGPTTGSTPFDLEADDDVDPLARKIELADEFRHIGDIDNARDLLQEVIEKADGDLKKRAQAMLDSLS